jgi:hypothetical protein
MGAPTVNAYEDSCPELEGTGPSALPLGWPGEGPLAWPEDGPLAWPEDGPLTWPGGGPLTQPIPGSWGLRRRRCGVCGQRYAGHTMTIAMLPI